MRYLAEDRANLDMLICAIGDRASKTQQFRAFLRPPTAYPSWTPAFYWPQTSNSYPSADEERFIHTGSARRFAASGYSRTRATIIAQPEQRFDKVLDKHRAILRAEGVVIGRVLTPLLRITTQESSMGHCVKHILHDEEFQKHAKPLPAWLRPAKQKTNLFIGELEADDDLRQWVQIIQTTYSYALSISPFNVADREIVAEHFCRTLVYNRTAEGEEAPADWASVFAVIINGPEHIPPDFVSSTHEGTPLDLIERATAHVTPFLKAFARLGNSGHKLAITSSAGFCMTSDRAVAGEFICIILGCNVPMVIRYPIREMIICMASRL
jgi:hypothetical protein